MSNLIVTDLLAAIPAPLVAEQVRMFPPTGVWVETVLVVHPLLEAMPEIGSVTLQLMLIGCECHPAAFGAGARFGVICGDEVGARVTLRTRLLLLSAMRRLEALSKASVNGSFSWASVASPPSPLKPKVPLPTTVDMMPAGVTRRTRWPVLSATYRFPEGSIARPRGEESLALIAGPLSPAKPPGKGRGDADTD